jgi:Na+-transporting NADH:ubiquinone oxidoreductase subunit NqrD
MTESLGLLALCCVPFIIIGLIIWVVVTLRAANR